MTSPWRASGDLLDVVGVAAADGGRSLLRLAAAEVLVRRGHGQLERLSRHPRRQRHARDLGPRLPHVDLAEREVIGVEAEGGVAAGDLDHARRRRDGQMSRASRRRGRSRPAGAASGRRDPCGRRASRRRRARRAAPGRRRRGRLGRHAEDLDAGGRELLHHGREVRVRERGAVRQHQDVARGRPLARAARPGSSGARARAPRADRAERGRARPAPRAARRPRGAGSGAIRAGAGGRGGRRRAPRRLRWSVGALPGAPGWAVSTMPARSAPPRLSRAMPASASVSGPAPSTTIARRSAGRTEEATRGYAATGAKTSMRRRISPPHEGTSTSLDRSTTARPGPSTAIGLRRAPPHAVRGEEEARSPGRHGSSGLLRTIGPRDLGAVEELDAVRGEHARAVRPLLLEHELPVAA